MVSFEFTGGNFCLDFANTVDDRDSDHPQEQLTDYARLVQWGMEAGLLTGKTGDRLRRLASAAPAKALTALRDAIRLRETIFEIFSSVALGRAVPAPALARLDESVRRATGHAHLVHSKRGFTSEWVDPERHLDAVLWPVSRAAAELLTGGETKYVRQCASETCSWLFLDRSKNHRRRWCDMKICGNRDKARRYYKRQQAPSVLRVLPLLAGFTCAVALAAAAQCPAHPPADAVPFHFLHPHGLAGTYHLTMTAEPPGPTATGRLLLWVPDTLTEYYALAFVGTGDTATATTRSAAAPLHGRWIRAAHPQLLQGATTIRLQALGAPPEGDLTSRDPRSPGLRLDGNALIFAPRLGWRPVDGEWTRLSIERTTPEGFWGTWETSFDHPARAARAAPHGRFCAVRER